MINMHEICDITITMSVKEHLPQLEPVVNPDATFHCTKQANTSAAVVSLRVGHGNVIHRWKKGSILTAYVNACSFPSEHHLLKAIEALKLGMEAWNTLNLGVSFKIVEDINSAVFQLVYKYDTARGEGKTYAMSFLPGFSSKNPNIFYHELGHILGLRHERAHELVDERRISSVQFGPASPKSVMNNDFDDGRLHLIVIHSLDKLWVQKFYAYDEPSFAGSLIVDVEAEYLEVARYNLTSIRKSLVN
ncbi:putative matrix metalloproteinase-11 protein [Phaeoacremonium minimum UCRPA7]|uniref:Putative matrix metalloproteinase-11 protein n=1 Tax=Phaeoacremonium minimum (strain UCR-PA7) TaxID=1286976 RepID=R8BH13_PHAM7|nr:putative matrix metalloproteinase-11 protein [Phaeoacremonium minimum UCRPA7]EON98527.1 putative matrix metalloproteinase-11 protein [Phaeoacremonium minimum UCRPA7]